jgi:serine phosphatase RsbU (regulator of sigma subunit)/tetratricopeptide (TPR) repeat protein
MAEYSSFFRHRLLFSRVIGPALLSILLAIQFPSDSFAQSPLPEVLNLYQQAALAKDYIQAAQYGYEIALRYGDTNEKDKALDFLQQSVIHAKKSNDQDLLHGIYHQMGLVHSATKKYSRSLESFQSALSTARKMKNNDLIKEDLINVSISYAQLDRLKKSIEYAEEGLSLAIADQDIESQKKSYQLLANFYKEQGNEKKSAENLTQYNTLISLQRAEQQKSLREQQIEELQENVQTAGLETEAAQAKLSEQNQRILQSNASLRVMESSLRRTTDYLNATSDSLKEVEAISRNRQMEIDLLEKDKELSGIKISEQETRLENEALIRNFIAVGSLLSIALVTVLIVANRKKVKANKKIEEQNKNIRSSINYAKRIQEAMLPKPDRFPAVLKNSFIFFKPRDTVSGDFYWMSEMKNSNGHDVAFAAVDCTGHGVPGAFMSMIGIKALNGLINRGISETNQILDSLDVEIRTALRQEVSGNNDGMDIALCIYHEQEKILEYSGAKSPLVYIQDHELKKIKGDTHSIGGRKKDDGEIRFKKHQVKIDKPTVLYLFSDGYKDQFGGKNNTKFLAKKFNNLLLQIHELPMEEQKNILELAFQEWKGEVGQTDDILVIGIKIG